MKIELSGEILSVTFRGGSYEVEATFQQDFPSGGHRPLGQFRAAVSLDQALELMSSRETKYLKITVEDVIYESDVQEPK